MKKNLALQLRPQKIQDVIGQSHLINKKNGIISRIINHHFPTSLVFYGKPGIGKTTIALAICHDLQIPYKIFNAAFDKKSVLEKIMIESNQQEITIIIIEEIHRMNKDRQDILLEALEHGKIIVFACTTENPFFVINPALRSRLQIIKLEPIKIDEMTNGLNNMIKRNNLSININREQIKKIASIANGDLRIAINIFELLINLYPQEKVTNQIIQAIAPNSNLINDKNGDEHYDLLSALQKSIRGSDVSASLHYFARLLKGGDHQALLRRMAIIAYEDIGLANPIIGVKVKSAIDTFWQIGLPEGMIPLGTVIIEMALSEKSNSGYLAISKAMRDIEKAGKAFPIPNHLRDSHYKSASKLKHGLNYQYPHNFNNHYVKQQYLPKELIAVDYYQAQTNNLYEKKLWAIYQQFTNKKNL